MASMMMADLSERETHVSDGIFRQKIRCCMVRKSFPHMLQTTTEIAFSLDIVEHTCAEAALRNSNGLFCA